MVERKLQRVRWRPRSALLSGLLVIVLLTFSARGQEGSAAAEPLEKPDFSALLARVEGGDYSVDFVLLRRAFAATEKYQPYGSRLIDELEPEMYAAFQERAYARALEQADRILAENPIYPTAHMVAMVAAGELGDMKRSEHHAQMRQRLFESICPEGAGADPDRPCFVIATYEEYFFLRSLGLRLSEQGLDRCAGVPCDVMDVKNPETGEEYTFYFDISIPFAHLGKQLKE